MSTRTLTIRHRPDGWLITHTSHALVTDTVDIDDPVDIYDVFAQAEALASGPVLWRVHSFGFDAICDNTAVVSTP